MKSKLNLIIGFFLLICTSCNNEVLDRVVNIEADPSTIQSRSVTPVMLHDPISQLVNKNIPVNITLCDVKDAYLASRRKSGQVQLDSEDSNSGREKWYFKKNDRGVYLQVADGYHKGWRNLCMRSPQENVCYVTNDVRFSDRNFYFNLDFENISLTDRYYIRIGKGLTSRKDVYLTATGSNNEGKIHFRAKGENRQQWVISPIEEFEIIDINYQILATDKLNLTPKIIAIETLSNNTAIPANRSFEFSETIESTSRFSKVEGLSITQKTSSKFNVGVPTILGGSIDLENTTTRSWTYTTEETEKRLFKISETITQLMEPFSSITARLVAVSYDANITYIATLRSVTNPANIIYLKGRWSGTQINDTRIELYDAKDKTLLNSLKIELD